VHGPEDGARVLALQVFATAAAMTVALWLLRRHTGFHRPSRALALGTLRDGVSLALYRGAGIVFQTSPPLLVGLLSTPVQVGYYGLADKLYKVPIAVMWPASRAIYPRIALLASRDRAKATRVMRTVVVAFVLTGGAIALALGALAEPLVRLVFGAKYEPAVLTFQVLALSLPLALFTHVVSYNVLMPFGRDRGINVLAWVGTILVVVLGVVLVPAHGALGMAIAVLVEVAIYSVLLLGFVFKFASPRPALRRLRSVRDPSPPL
jgi:polysaccharide transporter, PST family